MDFPWNKPTSYWGYPPFTETSKWTVWTLSPARWDRRRIWLILQRVAGNQGGPHFLGQGACTFESCGVLWKWYHMISPCSMVEELQYQTLVGRARILTQCFFCGCEIKHGLQFQIFLQSSFHMYDGPHLKTARQMRNGPNYTRNHWFSHTFFLCKLQCVITSTYT